MSIVRDILKGADHLYDSHGLQRGDLALIVDRPTYDAIVADVDAPVSGTLSALDGIPVRLEAGAYGWALMADVLAALRGYSVEELEAELERRRSASLELSAHPTLPGIVLDLPPEVDDRDPDEEIAEALEAEATLAWETALEELDWSVALAADSWPNDSGTGEQRAALLGLDRATLSDVVEEELAEVGDTSWAVDVASALCEAVIATADDDPAVLRQRVRDLAVMVIAWAAAVR